MATPQGISPIQHPNADLSGKLCMFDEFNRLEEALACFDSLLLLNNMTIINVSSI